LANRVGLLRQRGEGEAQVTPLELFFDLVYVLAVTQLSRHLLEHLSVLGALQTLLSRLAAILGLALLDPLSLVVPPLVLAVAATLVLAGIVMADAWMIRHSPRLLVPADTREEREGAQT
jgi:hypothetical protein